MKPSKSLTPQQRAQLVAEHERLAKELQDSGTLDVAAKLYSMAYVTFSRANAYAEEANSLLEPYGVVHKRLKTAVNNLMQSFDAYDQVMQTMIHGDKGALRQLCFDSDTLMELLDAFMLNNIEVHRGPYFKAILYLPEKNNTPNGNNQ